MRFDVRDYGARGDRIIDDASAVQATIEAATMHRAGVPRRPPAGRSDAR